ncbi:hypothetical protein DH2020_020538 [Rehmannia glutinosa]|uniref:Endonuclease/exonuclease/phosphatase domain-containing protein n=1 Tax=Rehmannia glutinosa TaxID=99300 RepID=A0ABR0WJX8_REHGL
METKLHGVKAKQFKENIGFSNGLMIDSSGRSGGLAILWSHDVDVSIKLWSNTFVDLFVTMDGFSWRFTGFYGNPDRNARHFSWDLLRRLQAQYDLPWIVGGDFNDILSYTEKWGGADFNTPYVSSFREVIDDCRLLDLGFDGPRFTWRKSLNNENNVWERLDRFLGSQCWIEKFKNYKVQNLDFFGSDHRAILLHTDFSQGAGSYSRQRTPLFRFEPFWLSSNSFKENLQNIWDESTTHGSSLKSKLKYCGVALKGWSRTEFGNLRNRIEGTQKELSRLNKAHPSIINVERIKEVERKLERMLALEEYYWKQRSRADWLRGGDKNTKFFHRKATARRKKNWITKLKKGSGEWAEDEGSISREIQSYFQNIFSSSNPSWDDMEMVLASVDKLLRPDSIIWHYEKSGIYSVRSGYRLALKVVMLEDPSTIDTSSVWWRKMWKPRIPSKIKIFA